MPPIPESKTPMGSLALGLSIKVYFYQFYFKALSVHNYNKRGFINDSQGNPKVKSTSYSPNRAVIR